MMLFARCHPVRFAHCDPAGFAYYPSLFTLADAVIEDWTAEVIGVSRRELHLGQHRALPTVTMNATFTSPALLGEMLDFVLATRAVGTSSVDFDLDVTCGGEPRFAVAYRQVLMDMRSRRAITWPPEWAERLRSSSELAGER